MTSSMTSPAAPMGDTPPASPASPTAMTPAPTPQAAPTPAETDLGAVVVTGAGSGMGLATALAFLAAGRHVIGLDIAPVAIETPSATASPATAEPGTAAPRPTANSTAPRAAPPPTPGSFTSAVADVRDRTSLETALAAALAPGESITAVAAIAGVYPPSTLDTFDDSQFRTIFDINVLGVLNTIAASRAHMTPGSSVITFASVDAFTVSPGQLLYGASKAAVVMLTKALALELAPANIRVNGIAPGWVETPGNAATGRMAAAATSVPLGRVAQPEEIARWVLTLADPQLAGFMTGEVVVLSGGDVIR